MILESVLAGMAGTALGAFLNQYLPHAKPVAIVHSIELSTALIDPDETVERRDLMRNMKEFPFPINISPPRGRVRMADWLEYLGAYHSAVEDLRADLNEIEAIIDKARLQVASDDIAAARPELSGHHVLWDLLEEAYQRTRKEVFSAETMMRLDQIDAATDLIDRDDSGDIIVPIGDGREIHFHWNYPGPTARRNSARMLAERCALAIATNDRSALLEMLDYIRTEIPNLKSAAESLNRSIEAVLSEYQHVVVTCLLMNSGRLEYMVDSRARLVVPMKKTPHRLMRRDGVRDEPILEDIIIDMVVANSSEEKESINEMMEILRTALRTRRRGTRPQSPRNVIPVSPKEPVKIRLVSENRLSEMNSSEELTRIYNGGERQAHMMLSIMKPRQRRLRVWHSKRIPFRNIDCQMPIHARKPENLRAQIQSVR
jgi:hypothetical protein